MPRHFLEIAVQAFVLAARSLRRSPGTSVLTVGMLAVGIGASATILTLLSDVILEPLPVQDQNRIAVMWGEGLDGAQNHRPFRIDRLATLGDAPSFEAVGGAHYAGATPQLVQIDDLEERFDVAAVTGNLFHVLGVRPAHGRMLRAEDDVFGASPVVVLSYATWRRVFGEDDTVVGRSLLMHSRGQRHTIIGIAPPGLVFPADADVWVPIVPWTSPANGGPPRAWVDAIARLTPSATIASAQSDLSDFLVREGVEQPRLYGNTRGSVETFESVVLGDLRPAFFALSTAVVLLLLLTSVNGGSMFLMRIIGKNRELSIGRALGARSWGLPSHIILEPLLLVMTAGVIGLGVSWTLLNGWGSSSLFEISRGDGLTLTLPSALASFGVPTLLAGLALLPAVGLSKRSASLTLGSSPRGSITGTGLGRLRKTFAIAQISLAFVLLVFSGLITRSLIELQNIDLGFAAQDLVLVEPSYAFGGVPERAQLEATVDQLAEGVSQIPGVVSVTRLLSAPLSGTGGYDVWFTSGGDLGEDSPPFLSVEVAGEDYFQTMDITLVAGTTLLPADELALAAVLSESAARALFGSSESGIGRTISAASLGGDPLTVVGIVRDTRYRDLRNNRPTIYLPPGRVPWTRTKLALRVAEGTPDISAQLRSVFAQTAPNIRVRQVRTVEAIIAAPLAPQRLTAQIMSAFAAVALFLASAGIFTVLVFIVGERRPELGVRMALGATPRDLVRIIAGETVVLVVLGLSVATAVSLFGTRALQSLLFEIEPSDLGTYAGAAVVVVVAAIAASVVPLWRASQVDPNTVLRRE